MAIINITRALERRDNSVGSEAGVSEPLPTSVKALAGFIVIMGLIILSIVAYKIGKWRRNKLRAASTKVKADMKTASVIHVDLSKMDSNLPEKSDVTVVAEPYKWTPVARPPVAHPANKAVKKGTKRFFGGFMPNKPAPLAVESHSPPPSYDDSATLPPTIIVSDEKGPASFGLSIVPPSPSSPLPSPARIQSIGPDTPLYKGMITTAKLKAERASQGGVKPLPRLMAVICTFTPSLADELSISVGEPITLLEEYEDEWCLVQRVGKADAERGVVPRFCLQEAPSLPSRRTSYGALRTPQ
ncbi:hypothetical protein BDY19DRAFT_995978 [Irpex rosettiformis]|uniref:Uncharacterized protein n=1 Tax=Irpex rosettiformis TaxID=378272 RepID=A0ACB8TWG1_9APHY|nr:hypothetical protein BDY19DRAFT_995978 [Irpex rosettiformis]